MTKNRIVSSFGGAGFTTGSPVCFLQGAGRRFARRGSLASGAFTLLELLVVVAVVIVLLAVAMPAMRGWRDSHTRSAAVGQVMALLHEARAAALAKGRPAYLVVSDHLAVSAGQQASDQEPGGTAALRTWTALAIYQQPADASLPPEQLTRWYRLPEGCHFVDPGEESSFLSAPEAQRSPVFPRMGSDVPLPLPYVAFGEAGRVLHPARSSYARLLLQTIPAAAPDRITLALFTGRVLCEW